MSMHITYKIKVCHYYSNGNYYCKTNVTKFYNQIIYHKGNQLDSTGNFPL